MYKNITAIVLAGGKSSRMGENKLFLQINGKTFVERILDLLNPLFPEVIFISNRPEELEKFRVKVFKDIYPYYGPLAGIHSGLIHSNTEYNFVVSIDMPFINSELIEHLLKNYKDSEITLPVADGQLQPLCGIYNKSVLPEIESLLKNVSFEGDKQKHKINVRLFDLLNSVKINAVGITDKFFYNENIFMNINTLNDFEDARKIFQKK